MAMMFFFICFVNMSICFSSLNSGSNGNCYFVGNGEDAVLIDAGLSCRETERRLRALDLSIHQVKAIFISHEHIDHVRGLESISKKYSIPVYINTSTKRNCRTTLPESCAVELITSSPITIGNLKITAFSKLHDAAAPVSFVVASEGYHVGILTDIGEACEQVKFHFNKCHAVFLEANYDEQMLEQGPYPFHLKQRIKSDKGHLSNEQAIQLFRHHRHNNLQYIILSHISAENNDPALVNDLFLAENSGVEVHIASRHQPTQLFTLGHHNEKKTAPEKPVQLALF